MIRALLLFLSLSSPTFGQVVIKEIHCFSQEESARQTYTHLARVHEHHEKMWKRVRRFHPPFGVELVNDGKDQFGRNHCLIRRDQRFSESEKLVIKKYQQEEDQKFKKEVQGLKDPWGGEAVQLDGKPRVIRSCKVSDTADCIDLIITARKGEDNVIEYRFWLGAQGGEGLAVYKSAGNDLELSKVMNQLKKDKENLKYTFAPKGSTGNFVEDARLNSN